MDRISEKQPSARGSRAECREKRLSALCQENLLHRQLQKCISCLRIEFISLKEPIHTLSPRKPNALTSRRSSAPQNLFHPLPILGSVHAHTVVFHSDYCYPDAVIQRSQLLQFLGFFEGRNWKTHQFQQRFPAVTINAQML